MDIITCENINKIRKHKLKQKSFNIKDAYKPTKESIEKQIKRHKLYEYYGIPIGVFDDGNNIYDADDIKAMDLISKGKKLPKDLEQRLLEKKHTRPNFNTPHIGLGMTNEEFEAEAEKFLESGN